MSATSRLRWLTSESLSLARGRHSTVFASSPMCRSFSSEMCLRLASADTMYCATCQPATALTRWRPLLTYEYSYRLVPDRVKTYVICNFWHPGTPILSSERLTLSPERQSARMSKITNDGLTRSGTGCFIAVPTWQQWASKGYWLCLAIGCRINYSKATVS